MRRVPDGNVIPITIPYTESPLYETLTGERPPAETPFVNLGESPKTERVYFSIPIFETPKKPFGKNDLFHPLYETAYNKDAIPETVTKENGLQTTVSRPISEPLKKRIVGMIPRRGPERDLNKYPLDARYASYHQWTKEIYNPFRRTPEMDPFWNALLRETAIKRLDAETEVVFDPDGTRFEGSTLKAKKVEGMIKSVTAAKDRAAAQTAEALRAYESGPKADMLLNGFIAYVNDATTFATMPNTLDVLHDMNAPGIAPAGRELTRDEIPNAAYLLKVNGLHKAFLFTRLVVDVEYAAAFSRNIHALPLAGAAMRKGKFVWNRTYKNISPDQLTWYRTRALVFPINNVGEYARPNIVLGTPQEAEAFPDYANLSVCLVTNKFGQSMLVYEDEDAFYECDLSLVISKSVPTNVFAFLSEGREYFRYLNKAHYAEAISASAVLKGNRVLEDFWRQLDDVFSQPRVLRAVGSVLDELEREWNGKNLGVAFEEYLRTEKAPPAEAAPDTDTDTAPFTRAVVASRAFQREYTRRTQEVLAEIAEAAEPKEGQTHFLPDPQRLGEIVRAGAAGEYVEAAYMVASLASRLLGYVNQPATALVPIGTRMNINARLVATAEPREISAGDGTARKVKVFVDARDGRDNTPIMSRVRAPEATRRGLTSLFEPGMYLLKNASGRASLLVVEAVTDALLVVRQCYEVQIQTYNPVRDNDTGLKAALRMNNRTYGFEASIAIVRASIPEDAANYAFVGLNVRFSADFQILGPALADRLLKEHPTMTTVELRESLYAVLSEAKPGESTTSLSVAEIYRITPGDPEREITQYVTRYEEEEALDEQVADAI